MSKRVSFLAAGIVAMASVAAAWGQDYAVKFERAHKVGDRMKVVSTAEQNASVQVSQPEIKQGSIKKVQLEADCKVLAVDDKGRIARTECVIRRFQGSVDGKAAPDVAAGTVVEIAHRDNGPSVQGKGVELTAEVIELLDLALPPVADPQSAGEDETFGTAERKKVGDTWAPNAGVMAAELAKKGMTIAKGDITGSIGIQKALTVGGEPCLRIGGQIRMVNLQMPGLPPGAKTVSSVMELKIAADYPVAAAGHVRGRDLTMSMKTQVEAPSDQGPVRTDVAMTRTARQEFTPLPAEGK